VFDSINFDELDIRKHKPAHLKKRRNPGKFDHAQFIGWDGEGITDENGHHHYVLFANSQHVHVRPTIGEDGEPRQDITTKQALGTLIESGRLNPKALHVIYFGSYDFNMLLRDCSRAALDRLRHGLAAYYDRYNLKVRFGKSLWVQDRYTKVSVTLWDVGSFFQQSFVKALQTWQVDTPHLANIIRQKANRSVFTLSDMDEIAEYCDQELEALVQLMNLFRDALEVCDLRISQWHGPGAIAAKLYDQHSIKAHKAVCPDEVNRAAQYAYGGGRIELVRQGHVSGRSGDVLNYDVRSCYPWAIAGLPSLHNSHWQHWRKDRVGSGDRPISRELSLYLVRWNFTDRSPFYPIRHRHADGSVCYPQTGLAAWVWTPEYELLERFFPGQYEVKEALIFGNENPSRPFTWVEDMYNQRVEWKREGYGAERILKLGLNSLYGKMIQQLGWNIDTGKLPAWHQLEWGGYVTSAARARIFAASYGNPGIVGFETDGILTTTPLSVPLSGELGGWELTEHSNLTYVQTGFYWLDDKVRYRGFDPGSVCRTRVLKAWADNKPTMEAQSTRHLGLNAAAHNNDWDRWGDWITSKRELDVSSASNKRIRTCPPSCGTLDTGLHNTRPYPEIVTEESAPYPLAWRPEGLPEWKADLYRMNAEMPDYDSYRFA
jgi:hypothetical protein